MFSNALRRSSFASPTRGGALNQGVPSDPRLLSSQLFFLDVVIYPRRSQPEMQGDLNMKAKLTLIASALLLMSNIAGAQEQSQSAKMTGPEAPSAEMSHMGCNDAVHTAVMHSLAHGALVLAHWRCCSSAEGRTRSVSTLLSCLGLLCIPGFLPNASVLEGLPNNVHKRVASKAILGEMAP